MTRQTSIDCYNQIKSEGLLSTMRLIVLEAILKTAPCTSAEASVTIINKKNLPSQSRARFTELRDFGVIKEIGSRKCKITGRKSIEWDLTDSLPKGETKKPNNKPRQLSASIKYIVREMHKNGIMFITQEELKEMGNKG